MAETIIDIKEKIDTLNAHAHELRNNPEPEGQLIAEETLILAEKENYEKGIAEALCTLGIRSVLKGNNTLSLAQFQSALTIAEEINNKIIKARAYNGVGIIYLERSDYNKSLEYFISSLSIREEIGDKKEIIPTLLNIGNVYFYTAEYSKALEYYMRTLAINEEFDDRNGIASSLQNIGLVYTRIDEHNKALEFLIRALHLYEESGDMSKSASALMNIGGTYGKIEKYSEALEFLMRALHIQEETGNKVRTGYCLQNIGTIYSLSGEYGKALDYFRRALHIQEETENKNGAAISLMNIGGVYIYEEFEEYNPIQGIEYLLKALAVAEEIKAKEIVFKIHKGLADTYEQISDIAKAHEHFKKYHFLKEEILGEENSRKINTLETNRAIAEIERARETERAEQKATFKILNRVLPRQIVDRIKSGEENIADKFPSASVLFADIVGFTPLAEKLGADEVLKLLSGIFSHFDSLCKKYGVEKIKTVGDSYMAASGVPLEDEDHLFKIAKLALAMQEDIKLNLDFKIPELSIRIGIHTGEVIAGVLGTEKLSYDLWGDTVNTAARMESHGEPDKIHCTEEVFKNLKNSFEFEERGEIEIKGKGKMKTYFLLKERSDG